MPSIQIHITDPDEFRALNAELNRYKTGQASIAEGVSVQNVTLEMKFAFDATQVIEIIITAATASAIGALVDWLMSKKGKVTKISVNKKHILKWDEESMEEVLKESFKWEEE